ncbi:MAG: ATP-binding protein [Solobacterium sp.]|nr:ATP-binding protein [Solobacterium sp.]
MEKPSFDQFTRNERQKQDTEKLIAQLKENPAIQYLFRRNEIPESYIETAPWRLRQWLIDFNPCQGCKGLEHCAQKQKGYFSSLTYDGMLKNEITACRFMKAKLKATAHKEQYIVSDLPDRLLTASFRTIQTAEEEEDYLLVLHQAMQLSNEYKGMYLYGTMGSGKTYLAACACNEHARNGEKVAFVHYPTFCQRMASMVQSGEYRDDLRRMQYAEFAVIDDIGAESVTEWNRDSILLPILNYRYENNLPTWFTSNCDIASLRIHYSFSRGRQEELKAARIIERITSMCTLVTLTGEDRRMTR